MIILANRDNQHPESIDAQETACYKCLLRIKGHDCDGMHAGLQSHADEVRILGGPP